MTKDQVLTHINDKHLKSKLHRSENLTLSKLLEMISHYHDKDALILVQPDEENNRVELTEKQTTKFCLGFPLALKEWAKNSKCLYPQ